MMLSKLELRQLIASSETNQVKLKVASPGSSEIAEDRVVERWGERDSNPHGLSARRF
jgi:hypothetical protein